MSNGVTEALNAYIAYLNKKSTDIEDLLPVYREYNLSRCADALDRIANRLESESISVSGTGDILDKLNHINTSLRQKR
jgi:hypothetical protein